MDPLSLIAPAPGQLLIAGVQFTILPPTPGDMIRTADRMKELAKAKCVSPLPVRVFRKCRSTTRSTGPFSVRGDQARFRWWREAARRRCGGRSTRRSQVFGGGPGITSRAVLPDFTLEAAAGMITDEIVSTLPKGSTRR